MNITVFQGTKSVYDWNHPNGVCRTFDGSYEPIGEPKVNGPLQRIISASCLGLLLALLATAAEGPRAEQTREALEQTKKDGNFKDAYDGFRKLALQKTTDPRKVGHDLEQGIDCLQRLNRVDEIDAFIEAVVDVHSDNGRLLHQAARSYLNAPHYGYMIAGEFHRGHHRGGGKVVNAVERDRIRGLQLMRRGMSLLDKEIQGASDVDRVAMSEFYIDLSRILLNYRGHQEAWRLQYLSNLEELPDYEDGWGTYGSRTSGAPVDADGDPVFHHLPESWEKAATDGERWRWTLMQAAEASPRYVDRAKMERAEFLQHQFGVQTMRSYANYFGRGPEPEKKGESGTYALQTLGDGETIARLAVGVRRFDLPDQFNHIHLFQQIAEGESGFQERALTKLADVYENRRQYPRAADLWRRNLKHRHQSWKQARLEQIVGDWGRFEPVTAQPAGQGATVEFRFRNGQSVSFEAHRINIDKLLKDLQAYLKSNPGQLDFNRINIGNIGHRLVQQNQQQYVGERVAQWQLELEPRPDHFDDRITVNTPLQQGGAYLLTARMADGNVSKLVLWVDDTAIVKKQLSGKVLYYVADARTGEPVADAKLELFGYHQKYLGNRKYAVSTKQLVERTDRQGQVVQPGESGNQRHQWVAIATTEDGRLAYYGITGAWANVRREQQYNQTKVYAITDRPVYRPDQTVHYKLWVRRAQYDQDDASQFAGRTFTLEIYNPQNEKVVTRSVQADEYGGVEGEYALPGEAPLGVYRVVLKDLGGGTFRVEQYKKPEFEVSIEAPGEPVMLGEKITARIAAKYYFGSPVTNAKVKYRVMRSSFTHQWFPYDRWDWLYGSGYWWFGYDYTWYPGWAKWGCLRPPAAWWPGRHRQPPEMVAQAETEIGPDGTVQVEIDTALARQMHPDQDHRYQIIAEVVDPSRRTIVGSGEVLVARQPFKVFAWVDRGYYRVGDTIEAQFSARTLDQKPVSGQGRVTLYRVDYDQEHQPVETEVRTWQRGTDEDGRAAVEMTASRKGQYRVVYKLTDTAGHTIEGGYLFTVVGDDFDGAEFEFTDLELITDRRNYDAGDTVKLQVNTNHVGSTVLLFVRPSNSVYLPPRVLRLQGKSTVVDIDVRRQDMPNLFVEAVTVFEARIHTQVREIHVPPEQRVLDVQVEPSADEYRPGEHAEVKVTLTDPAGRPFVGSLVMAIYDKSVEYISGGSNVGDIKKFFWSWKRTHYPRTESNLEKTTGNLTLPNKPGMTDLGAFGHGVVEEYQAADKKQLGRGSGGEAKGNANAGRSELRRAGAPMQQAAKAAGDALAEGQMADGAAATGEPGGAKDQLVEPTVRSQFADTALWRGSLKTDQDGTATVKLDMPENLTTWKIRTWGMGHGTRVGEGSAEVVTRKNLIVRLQAPRFFVQKDEVVLSANVHNYLKQDKRARVVLELDGDALKPQVPLSQTVVVEAGGEARVDWRVQVVAPGQATVRIKALTDEESDAMQMSFPVYVHGMLKTESFSGALRPEETAGRVTLQVPAERRINQTRLEVRYSPTLAGAMVDALPYLIDYPHGCTEQTLNRFLPAVITQNVLLRMGLDLEEIRRKRTNLNAQEIGDDRQRADRWKRLDRNPVFDKQELQEVVNSGVQRLADMQLSDGGWGWFSGYGERSYPHTTAVVVHGLQVARQNDVAVPQEMLNRGIRWLARYQNRQAEMLNNAPDKKRPYKTQADNVDALVYMVLVDADVRNADMLEFLYRDRTKLAVYSNALFGMALDRQNEREKLAMVMQNISQFVVEDDENQTAYLNLPGGFGWYWYGSQYEAHAYYLKLLAATEPRSRVASRMVKYLLNNRKHATYWNSTRDTALVIEAMADYMKASGEDRPDMTVEIWLDGEKQKEVRITGENLFSFDNRFVQVGDAVETGKHTLELRKRGTGPLYYNAYLTNFTLEDHIEPAGLEVKILRNYFRLVPEEKTVQAAGSRGQALDQRVEHYRREPLPNLATLESGDLVEVELVLQSKNDYEYIMLENMKAAGFEPVGVRSGYTGNELGAYVEFRDERVTMFVQRLARGRHSVTYRTRAEIPGRFSALPAKISAMYAPELKGNSEEIKLKIED